MKTLLPGVRTLRQTFGRRLAVLLSVSWVISVLLVLMVYRQNVAALNRTELNDALAHLQKDLDELDGKWDQAADNDVSILEWSGVFAAKPDARNARLQAFFTAQAATASFSGAVLRQSEGSKVLFEYWAMPKPAMQVAISEKGALHFDSSTGVLYSSYTKALRGAPEAQILTLYRTWDHATLRSVGDKDDTKFLILDQTPLLSSEGPLSLSSVRAGSDGYQEYEENGVPFHRIVSTLKIIAGYNGQAVPLRVLIKEKQEYQVPTGLVLILSLGLLVSLGFLLFITLGRWLSEVGSRLNALTYGVVRFQQGSGGDLSDEIWRYLQKARGQVHDQIDIMVHEILALMTTAQRRDEEQTAYLQTLELLQDAVLEIAPDGQILRATPAWTRIVGLEEGMGLCNFQDLVSQQDRSSLKMQFSLLQDGNEYQLSHRFRLKLNDTLANAEERWLEGRFTWVTETQLGPCIRGIVRDITHQHQQELRINHLAMHDALTDLPNRTLLTDRFEVAIATARRLHRQMGVLLIDLDGFKEVNDTFGHRVGDLLLVEVSRRLMLIVRGEDTLARLGGDEFAVIVNNVDGAMELDSAVQRILATLAQEYLIDDHVLHITSSIGVTLFPTDDADADTLLRHADQAMYQAKQSGRNRACSFDVVQDQSAESNLRLQERVRQALKAGELCLYYQPKVNMRTGSVDGFEALLRWLHPQDGLIPPLNFLPQIEQTDLIVDIGEWVLEQALTQTERWLEQGVVWSVGVNIAARQFQRTDFLQSLRGILERHPRVSPSLLNIEILESVALGDIKAVSTVISECQKLGVSFSLDDFGTGYSSLSYLKALRADTLKIDQAFVRQMPHDMEDLTLVETVVNIARMFKIEVIAEGVETVDHGILLMRMGCDLAQGYGIARPMPAGEVFQWAQNFKPALQWQQWANIAWEWADLQLLLAQGDHEAWVRQVLLAIEGGATSLPRSEIWDQHQCRFGHWYDGPGRERYGQLPEYKEIKSVHTQIHQVGPAILHLHHSGDIAQARELGETLLDLKLEFSLRLAALQESVRRTLA